MKVLIFDFDGTIADSTDLIIDVMNDYVPNLDRESYIKMTKAYFEDHAFKNFFKVIFYQLRLFRKIKEIRRKINERILTIEPFEEVREVLKQLNGKVDLYIISSNFRENILRFLDQNQMNFFKEVYGDGSLLHKAKTISEIKSKYSKEDMIYYIGDELRDIDAARKAGVEEIGVTWGVNSKTDFLEFNTKMVFEDPKELLRL